MFAEIRLISPIDYNDYQILENVSNLTFDTRYSDIGAISFDIPVDDADNLGVTIDSLIAVCPDGTSDLPNMWYEIDGFESSRTGDGALIATVSGKSLVQWLSDCIVYPSTWPEVPTQNPDGTTATVIQGHSFEDATPGNIMRTLIARGVERGGLAWLEYDNFTGEITSDNQAWATTLSNSYSNGTSLLQVLQDLRSARLVDFHMVRNRLELYNFGALAQTYTPDQVLFRRGENITEQTRNLDATQTASVVLVIGDLSAVTESSSSKTAAAEQAIGRRKEFFLQEGGLTDIPTLQMLADTQLSIVGHIQTQDTVGVDDLSYRPWIDYTEGAWVWLEFDGNVPQKIQVQQIAATQQESGDLQIGVVLGDIIKDQDDRNQNLLNNISAGNGALPNQNDFLGPTVPTGLSITASPYRDSNGIAFDQVAISWIAPATNSNGSPVVDLDHYDVQYNLDNSDTWNPVGNVPAGTTPLACFISHLQPGQTFVGRVRAVDSFDNVSPWQQTSEITLPQYSEILPKPSQPQVLPIIQGLAVSWDGLDANGLDYGPGFSQINIYVGTSSDFTPGPTNIENSASVPGATSILGLDYTIDYYVKIIALDNQGNQSPPTDPVGPIQAKKVGQDDVTNVGVNVYTQSTQPTGAQTGDLWINIGNSNAIYTYNGSVWTLYQFGTGAIAVNSIDATKIVTEGLAASVIATGTLSAATITMGASGYIDIGSPGENGIQISETGITAWNNSSQTFSLSSAGALTMSGTIVSSTITGTDINGGTITGATLRTPADGSGFYLDIGGANHDISFMYTDGSVSGYIDGGTEGAISGISLRNTDLGPGSILELATDHILLQFNGIKQGQDPYSTEEFAFKTGQSGNTTMDIFDRNFVITLAQNHTIINPTYGPTTFNLSMSDTYLKMTEGTASSEYHFVPGGGEFRLVTLQNGSITADGTIHFWSPYGGAPIGFATWVDNGTLCPHYASAFTQVSSEKFKSDIQENITGNNARDIILDTPVFTYTEKATNRRRIGFVAERSRREISGFDSVEQGGIDLTHAISVMWAYLRDQIQSEQDSKPSDK